MIKDFPYTSFEHYLEVNGLFDLGDSAMECARTQYRTLYQKYYRKQAKSKQLNVLITNSDFDHLEGKAKTYGLSRATKYLIHLIRQDREGKSSTPPNLLVEIEVGLLKSIDALTKLTKASPETRAKVLEVLQQLEELLILLGS
ncbi:MAG: hypothetical protein Crog4KO_19110 [Crocinitomicaceae bacterium]